MTEPPLFDIKPERPRPSVGYTSAVGRFRPEGRLGFHARTMPDAPLRATREEALADERAYRGEQP